MQRVITGFHSIEEILRSRLQEEAQGAAIFFSSSGPRVKRIIEEAKRCGVPCKAVERREIERKVQALPPFLREHKGILLTIEDKGARSGGGIFKSETLDEFLAKRKDVEYLTVILLDGISDCHNMGSIIRSAHQLGLDAVIVMQHRSAGGEEGILKSSAGASAWMNVISVSNLNQAISLLKDAGFWVYAADMGGESLQNVDFAKRVAVVMGSEGEGVSRLVKKNADVIVSIPMSGQIDSLNVSVAAGIIMYEIASQRESVRK